MEDSRNMIQRFTINWDSSWGKVAYSSPPSAPPQPLKKKDSFPWTVGRDQCHTLSRWSMWGMSAGTWSLFTHGSWAPHLSPHLSYAYKLFHCTVWVIAEQVKEETQMMLHPQTKTCMGPSVSYWGPAYGEAAARSAMGRWADAEIPTHHPGAQGERDGGQGLFQN